MTPNNQDMQSKQLEIQNKMLEVQKKLASIEVEGNAGGDMVKIVLNCRYEAKKVTIDPSVLMQSMQILGDLVASAITDATRKVESTIQAEMFKVLQGVNAAK
jgi:nucleoid-associated protein EbfC